MKECFKELQTMPSSSFQLQEPVTVPFPKTVSLLLTHFIIIYDTRRLIDNDIDLLLFHFLTFCTAHPPHQRIGRNGHGPHRSGVEMKIVSNMSIITPLFIIMKTQPSSILNKVCYHVAVKSHRRPGCGHVRMCEVILRPCKSLWAEQDHLEHDKLTSNFRTSLSSLFG